MKRFYLNVARAESPECANIRMYVRGKESPECVGIQRYGMQLAMVRVNSDFRSQMREWRPRKRDADDF